MVSAIVEGFAVNTVNPPIFNCPFSLPIKYFITIKNKYKKNSLDSITEAEKTNFSPLPSLSIIYLEG